jgi:GT2 family glycosyltransferase
LPSSQPVVTIVILNWNGIEDTRECLQSLRNVTYPSYRIVVVDNGSEHEEGAALETEFGDAVTIIQNERNVGFAGGANIGIRQALEDRTNFVLLLNNDVTVDPGFLDAMVEFASARSDLAAACPKAYLSDQRNVIYSAGGTVNLWTGVARQVGRGETDHGQFERAKVRDYADGLCMLIPAAAIEKVGLLDEDYFAYWEETDWCIRARDAGLRCYYVANAVVWHKAKRSREASDAFNFNYRRNSLMFVRKRGGPLHLVTALAAQAFYYAPLYFLRHPTRVGRAAAELRAVLWHVSNRVRRRPLL